MVIYGYFHEHQLMWVKQSPLSQITILIRWYKLTIPSHFCGLWHCFTHINSYIRFIRSRHTCQGQETKRFGEEGEGPAASALRINRHLDIQGFPTMGYSQIIHF